MLCKYFTKNSTNNSSTSPEPSANTSTGLTGQDIPIFGPVVLQAKRRHIVYAKHLCRR
jgi:hypothetical protein